MNKFCAEKDGSPENSYKESRKYLKNYFIFDQLRFYQKPSNFYGTIFYRHGFPFFDIFFTKNCVNLLTY